MKNINLICHNCHDDLFSGIPYWNGNKGFVCGSCGKTTYCENKDIGAMSINKKDTTDIQSSNLLWVILFLFLPYPLPLFISLYVREKIGKKMGDCMLWIFLLWTIVLYTFFIIRFQSITKISILEIVIG